MYEVTDRLQKMAKECEFSLLNEGVVQLKQISNWNSLNNNIFLNKDIWQKINDNFRNSLKMHQSSNFRWISNNTSPNFSNVLLSIHQSMSEHRSFFNANLKEIIKSYSEIISRYELNQDFIDSCKNIQESLNKINELQFDALFSEINYPKEDLTTEIGKLSVDLQNQLQYIDDSIDPKVQMEEYLSDFRIKHRVLYQVFLVISVTISLMGSVDTISNIIPKIIEDNVVYLQGNSDIYYIKEEDAKIYECASSQTNVIDFIFYGEKVIKLEDAKLWVKVLCKGKSGNLVIGWIAKRNLMSYKDYQFNSDKLYNID